MKKYLVAVGILVLLFFILGLFPASKKQNIYKTTTVTLGDTTINVEIADTDALRALGLSGRTSLEDGKGMLFVFDTPGTYGFWMKDMNFSIDMLWASGGKIIYTKESVSPTTFPRIFEPTSPAEYVVELPAGFLTSHELKVGDSFSTGL